MERHRQSTSSFLPGGFPRIYLLILIFPDFLFNRVDCRTITRSTTIREPVCTVSNQEKCKNVKKRECKLIPDVICRKAKETK